MTHRPAERLTVDDLLVEARRTFSRLEPREAAEAVGDGAMVIDTRCEDDRRRNGVIPGSIHVPRTVLEWRADPSSPYRDERIAHFDAVLVVVCNDGYSSSLAAATLQAMGLHRATDIEGGFKAWKAAGLPVEPYRAPARRSFSGPLTRR